MHTAEPTATPASSPVCKMKTVNQNSCEFDTIHKNSFENIESKREFWYFTALASVETAEATNIIENVTTISMIRAWRFVPEGDVVPSCVIGCSSSLNVIAAEIAPVNCAAA